MRHFVKTLSMLLPTATLLTLNIVGCYGSETGRCWNGTEEVARPYELPTEPNRTVVDADTYTDEEGLHDTIMKLEIWDCASPAWWYNAPPRKVIFEYRNQDQCALYDTVQTWELECGVLSEIEVQHGDLDQDGLTLASGDCDDAAPGTYPGATDYCNDGIDQNCDGVDSQGEDSDHDGFSLCETDQFDCDDQSASIFPGAEEQCDGVDNDCNGLLDDGVPALLSFDAPAETESNNDYASSNELVADGEGIFRVQGGISSPEDNDYYRFQLTGEPGQSLTLSLDLEFYQSGPVHAVTLVNSIGEYEVVDSVQEAEGSLHAEYTVKQHESGQSTWYVILNAQDSSCHAYLLTITPVVN